MNDTGRDKTIEHDQIRADRACAGCGFNLYGQSVTREEHYGLSIARCPECGTVAALQQYPAMTHWVNRFRMIIGATYIFLLLGLFFASSMGIGGFMFGGSSVASSNLGEHINTHYNAWRESQASQATGQAATAPQFTGAVGGWSTSLTPEYIENGVELAIDDFGSFIGNADREWVLVMVPAFLVCFAIGVLWSVALLGSSRKRALLIPLASCVLAGVFVISVNPPDKTFAWVYSYAHQLYIPTMVPLIGLIEFAALALGIYLGRKLARLVVLLALPPRMRVPLGILWARDGLAMPKP